MWFWNPRCYFIFRLTTMHSWPSDSVMLTFHPHILAGVPYPSIFDHPKLSTICKIRFWIQKTHTGAPKKNHDTPGKRRKPRFSNHRWFIFFSSTPLGDFFLRQTHNIVYAIVYVCMYTYMQLCVFQWLCKHMHSVFAWLYIIHMSVGKKMCLTWEKKCVSNLDFWEIGRKCV